MFFVYEINKFPYFNAFYDPSDLYYLTYYSKSGL